MNIDNKRYERQTKLKGFGEAAQQKLAAAKVLVAGAGGLGCPVLQYLAAAGVGTIGIIDDDTVSLSDLHRQILYSVDDIGKSKAERAGQVLQQLNPEIHFNIYNERLTTGNAIALISNYDIVVDCTDNFPSRYMINDACVLVKKPLVLGAVSQFEGQVALFNCRETDGQPPVNYRDLFPVPPKEGEIQNCSEAGVLGTVTGIIGSIQANEIIKLITGIGQPLINRLLIFNALNNQSYELEISQQEQGHSLVPKDINSFETTEYGAGCSAVPVETEITAGQLMRLIKDDDITVIDVREFGEEPEMGCHHKKIPLSILNRSNLDFDGTVWVFVCQSGRRSLEAISYLQRVKGIHKKMLSLKGGIAQWPELTQMKEQV